ncbi:MAG: SPFH domain-containing protein [Candidatus Electrothrix scaldis]|nr:MAG: SPFH domain-containing protein [Candidatus Electrothrix sp. GW3-3]
MKRGTHRRGLKAALSIFFFLIILPGCGFVVLLGIFGTNPNTPAGYEGYVFEKPRIFGKGGFRGELKGPSNYGISLWRNEVTNVDFRPQTYPETFKILAKDELNISFRFQSIIKVKPGTIRTVVEDYAGDAFYERYIKEPLRAMVRKHVQYLNSREIKEKRKEIAAAVASDLEEHLKGTPFVLVSSVVGNIDYPPVVTQAVEKKLAAQQLLDEKETQREIAKKDAEIRIEEAKGIAEAQKIINTTLTQNYLQHEAIQAQLQMASSPNHTTVYIPAGANGIPLIGTLNADTSSNATK